MMHSLFDTLVKHVHINVGVTNDCRYGFFNIVLKRRLFLITLILSAASCCFLFLRDLMTSKTF